MAAANAWNINNLNLNAQTGILSIGPGHVLIGYTFPLLTIPVGVGGQHTVEIHKLHMLALSLCKRDPNIVPNPVDQIVLGDHVLTLAATMRILGVAFTAGFVLNFPPGPLSLNYVSALQSSLAWAQVHTIAIDTLNANDWAALPAIPAAQHNHYRFQFTLGMFVGGGLFVPLVDFLSLIGYIHIVASRGANSRFAEVVTQQENFVGGAIVIAPSMRPAMIAQAFLGFSLPLLWRSFPHPTDHPDAGVVACLQQRFYARCVVGT